MDADGTNVTRLTYSAARDVGPAFSADGSRIAFTSDRDGNREIHPARVDGSDRTVTIQDGAAQTRKLSVTLTLNASDPAPATGVSQVRISNTETVRTSASWMTCAATVPWTLSSGAGTKTVYMQYRDAAGNESAIAQDTIRYKP